MNIPNKTVKGALGAMVAGIILAGVSCFVIVSSIITEFQGYPGLPLVAFLFLGLVCGTGYSLIVYSITGKFPTK